MDYIALPLIDLKYFKMPRDPEYNEPGSFHYLLKTYHNLMLVARQTGFYEIANSFENFLSAAHNFLPDEVEEFLGYIRYSLKKGVQDKLVESHEDFRKAWNKFYWEKHNV